MRYIVTGASGFVGSRLVKELLLHSETESILCIDLQRNDDRLPDDAKISFLNLTVENIDQLRKIVKKNEYDVFFHFAWVGSAGPLRMDENVQVKNALWTVNCLRTANDLGIKKFVVAGSIMEFEAYYAIYDQGTQPTLSYLYGIGKSLAHELCKPIANSLNIDLIWAYITNTYGVGEKSPRFINSTLRKIIKGERLEFTSGTQNYDFIYIDDVVKAFYLLGIKGKANNNYIIGSGRARPLRDFILDMVNENAPGTYPNFGNIEYTGVNLPLEVFSTKQIEIDCGFYAEVSFAEGTRRTIDWLRKEESTI
ncbi:MAG TPA: NAD(P)-dependent oxidoreductase [Bacilli bacterium]|nr:NAD(P)-dependent oxidoreductase [Bacilli bacterium]